MFGYTFPQIGDPRSAGVKRLAGWSWSCKMSLGELRGRSVWCDSRVCNLCRGFMPRRQVCREKVAIRDVLWITSCTRGHATAFLQHTMTVPTRARGMVIRGKGWVCRDVSWWLILPAGLLPSHLFHWQTTRRLFISLTATRTHLHHTCIVQAYTSPTTLHSSFQLDG